MVFCEKQDIFFDLHPKTAALHAQQSNKKGKVMKKSIQKFLTDLRLLKSFHCILFLQLLM